jgi:hypothetical protein
MTVIGTAGVRHAHESGAIQGDAAGHPRYAPCHSKGPANDEKRPYAGSIPPASNDPLVSGEAIGELAAGTGTRAGGTRRAGTGIGTRRSSGKSRAMPTSSASVRATIAFEVANLEESERKRILCVECVREPREGERGWRAYLTTDEDEPAEAIV